LTSAPHTRAELARYVDHTLLKAEATAADIEQLCREGREYGFFAVCVNPLWVPRCVELLRESQTRIVSVAGFPLGASPTAVKALEARLAVERGAAEADMVVNLAALRAEDKGAVVRDIAEVVTAAKGVNESALVKVILETRALTTSQIILGCRCVAEAQADFVKTSTGFHPAGGATVEHVALLHRHSAPIPVKAAGGIRTLATALAMIEAGAARLGMSASVAVLRELRA
jgi:deoxyribose-phosphate aldolase